MSTEIRKPSGNAIIYNTQPAIEVGYDIFSLIPPKARKFYNLNEGYQLKGQLLNSLRTIDRQTAMKRFTWYNLPEGITAELIERILFDRGKLMFFKLNGKAFVAPYTVFSPDEDDGSGIDMYGRYIRVTPVPYRGPITSDSDLEPLLKGISFKVHYEVALPEDYDYDPQAIQQAIEESAVLLHDYTGDAPERVVPRDITNLALLDLMAEMPAFMRTSLINSTGVRGLKVADATEEGEVNRANAQIQKAALSGDIYTPIKGTQEFQDLTNGVTGNAEEFLLAMQSLDNLRLSTWGLDNGGLFQKRSHLLEAEQEMNAGNVGMVLKDSLDNRQEWCTIINSIWGTSMWCEVSETVLGIDTTGDGVIGDNEAGQKEAISAAQQEVTEDVM